MTYHSVRSPRHPGAQFIMRGGDYVAKVYPGHNEDYHLLMAAPDLLNALTLTAAHLASLGARCTSASTRAAIEARVREAEAALKRATGVNA